jgi:hypothetical protein
MKHAIALLFAWGCSDLPPIDYGVCGNRVLEKGELCDTFTSFGGATSCGDPEGPHPCTFVCSESNVCPPGWGCGGDGRCRMPAGRFSTPEVLPFRSTDVRIADIDGDGIQDLIGNDRSRFSVAFQTAPRSFDQEFHIETRLPNGQPFLRDLDGDGRDDVVVPSNAGLMVLLGQSDRSLLSRVYDTELGIGGTTAVRIVVTSGRLRPVSAADVVVIVGGVTGVLGGGTIALASGVDASMLPQRIPSGPIPSADPRNTFALWAPGSRNLTLYRVEGDALPNLRPMLRGTLSTSSPLQDSAEFADVNGDGATDLIASIEDMDEPFAIALSSSTGASGLSPFCNVRTEVFDSESKQFVPISAGFLRAGDFDGDGFADYVFNIGVLTTAGTPPRCGAPFRGSIGALSLVDRWREAELGDFNGDGRLDFAASSFERQLDVYFGSGTGGFSRRTVLLEHMPTRLRTGDYDGDFVDDLAFVFEDPAGDLISVVYGDAGGELSDARPIGRFSKVTDAISGQWVFDPQSLDLISDLLIESRDPQTNHFSAAVAYGSTARQMFAPLTFPDESLPQPIAVAVGDFCNCEESGCVERRDLAGIRRSIDPPKAELWIAVGADGPPGRLVPAQEPIPLPAEIEAGFRFECSQWVVGNIDGDPREEVLGIDNAAYCIGPTMRTASRAVLFDPDGSACGKVVDARLISIEEDGFTGATRIRLRDLDADGDLDLLLVFAGDAGSGQGLIVMWNDGGFESTTIIDAPAGTIPIDADAIQLDTDPGLELALRTYGIDGSSVWIVDSEDGRTYAPPSDAVDFVAVPSAITAGDLDGDGLEDLVLDHSTHLSISWGEDGAQ